MKEIQEISGKREENKGTWKKIPEILRGINENKRNINGNGGK